MVKVTFLSNCITASSVHQETVYIAVSVTFMSSNFLSNHMVEQLMFILPKGFDSHPAACNLSSVSIKVVAFMKVVSIFETCLIAVWYFVEQLCNNKQQKTDFIITLVIKNSFHLW